MTGEEDSDRELRAMVLLTLPYPPLPILAARVDDVARLVESDDAVITSHTLMARGLAECAWRQDEAANAERKTRQQRVFQEFLHTMAVEGFATQDPERLYMIYCRFTIDHIATFFPPGHPIDIRFQPYSYTCKGDKTHRKIAEFMAAQSIFFEDKPPITREQYVQNYSLRDMLFALRARVGHVMTDEERSRLESLE